MPKDNNKRIKPFFSSIIFSVAFALVTVKGTGSSSASVIVSIAPSGADVVMTVTGSLNISDLIPGGPISFFGVIAGGLAGFDDVVAAGNWQELREPTGIQLPNGMSYTPTNFVSSPPNPMTSRTGEISFSDTSGGDFGFALFSNDGGVFYVSADYTSGAAFGSFATWNNKTIGGLGLVPGSYQWGLTNGETIVVNIVPEPAGVLFCGEAATLGLVRRRRCRSIGL